METWLPFMTIVSMNIVQNLLLIQNQGANVGGRGRYYLEATSNSLGHFQNGMSNNLVLSKICDLAESALTIQLWVNTNVFQMYFIRNYNITCE